ncbi:MAG: SRPBCC domain-containing protein, partial [Myxococcota bacterium]
MTAATEELKVSAHITASPNAIYAAWMDERRHSAFTGRRATVDPWVGGRVTGDDGKIDATHIHLDTGRRIVMTWRTSEFPVKAHDSRVEIRLEPVAGGTTVSVHQTDIPDGLSTSIKKIWRSLYLDSMKRFFSSREAARKALRDAAK